MIALPLSLSTTGGPAAPAPPSSTFTLTAFPSYENLRIYQRSTTSGGGNGKGQGPIAVTLNASVAGTVNARMASSVGGSTVIQAQWQLTIGSTGSQTFIVTGVDAGLFWGELQLQDSTGAWQGIGQLVGVGHLTYGYGQSLMVRFLGRQDAQTATYASLGITPSAYSSTLIAYSDGNSYPTSGIPTATQPWQQPGDVGNGNGPNSVGVGQYLNQMIAMLGVNCGFVGYAQGGVIIGTFVSGQTNWTRTTTLLTRINNAFEILYHGQGHGDSVYGAPGKGYATGVQIVQDQFTALNTTFPTFGRYVWTIPAIGVNTWGTPYQINFLRQGAINWCAANSATYVHANDIAQVDSIHESQAGAVTLANEMYRATRARYGQTGGIGPAPVSAVRTAAQMLSSNSVFCINCL